MAVFGPGGLNGLEEAAARGELIWAKDAPEFAPFATTPFRVLVTGADNRDECSSSLDSLLNGELPVFAGPQLLRVLPDRDGQSQAARHVVAQLLLERLHPA